MNLLPLAQVDDITLVVVLTIVTAVVFVLEIITPSFGVLAIVGLCSYSAAVFFAFRVGMLMGFLILLAGIVGTPLYLYAVVKILPRSPIGRRLFLKAPPAATNDAVPTASNLAELVGKTGTAETYLRPSGVVKIEGRRVDARAERDMIDKGESVTVIRAGGTDVVVRRAEAKTDM
jgi:membrane-bound ClpP family serine protease